MNPSISVVIPTYRRHDLLRTCLAALERQSLDPARYEVLVCDDANDEVTRRFVAMIAAESRCMVRYLPVVGAHGPAAARNVGWRAAAAENIAFTDDDCLPDSGWLASGLAALASGSDAAWGRLEMPLPPNPTDYERNAAGLATAVFVTANCFCRRRALEIMGGFDERFTAAWREDSDLYFSLLEHGLSVGHAPEALVVHPVRPAGWGISLRQQQKTEFDALLYKKHPRLYRERIPRFPPDYYASVGSLGVAMGMATAGHGLVSAVFLTIWLGLTLSFCFRRLRETSRAPSHMAEMAFTSALIPPLSLFWRARGLWKFRTFYL
ncbi:MAG TPA: glycosyltransferase [Pirellulales bacterium]|nr:glycosyltransferase [Pirellulales bacterium]